MGDVRKNALGRHVSNTGVQVCLKLDQANDFCTCMHVKVAEYFLKYVTGCC